MGQSVLEFRVSLEDGSQIAGRQTATECGIGFVPGNDDRVQEGAAHTLDGKTMRLPPASPAYSELASIHNDDMYHCCATLAISIVTRGPACPR